MRIKRVYLSIKRTILCKFFSFVFLYYLITVAFMLFRIRWLSLEVIDQPLLCIYTSFKPGAHKQQVNYCTVIYCKATYLKELSIFETFLRLTFPRVLRVSYRVCANKAWLNKQEKLLSTELGFSSALMETKAGILTSLKSRFYCRFHWTSTAK